jgi:hypothetical protein
LSLIHCFVLGFHQGILQNSYGVLLCYVSKNETKIHFCLRFVRTVQCLGFLESHTWILSIKAKTYSYSDNINFFSELQGETGVVVMKNQFLDFKQRELAAEKASLLVVFVLAHLRTILKLRLLHA